MKNNKENSDDYLLGHFFSREVTDGDGKEIEGWAKESPEYQKVLKDSTQILKDIETLKLMQSINNQNALIKVKNKIKRQSGSKNQLLEYWQKIAAILILPLLIYSLYEGTQRFTLEDTAKIWNEIATPVGLRSQFKLPDGTIVWLNGNTRLKYPLEFSGNERLVELEGEAFFKVVSDKKHPFIVDAGKINIQAVGTCFNVSAYKGDSKLETALTEGKVNIFKESEKGRQLIASLEPGQLSVFDTKTSTNKVLNGNLDKYTAWRSGKIIFRNDNLDEVLRKLGQWYNVDFELTNKVNMQYAYTGTFQGESLPQILEYIELTTPIRFTYPKPKMDEANLFQKMTIQVDYMKKKTESK